jgi:hypothetical protein
MAQHISIIENKEYSKIIESIYKRFSTGTIGLKTSMKYHELSEEDYKINKNDRVFLNYRKMKGVIEVFEIHFDTKQNKILKIFLVK